MSSSLEAERPSSDSGARLGLRRRSPVPPPLTALLGALALLALAWALVMPPWQPPDEDHHFAYAQYLAETLALPGEIEAPEQSAEQRLATDRSNAEQTAQVPSTEIEWSETNYEIWRAANAALPSSSRSDGGGPNSAAQNPPLFYAYTALAYRAASAGDVFDRLYAMRLLSGLLVLVTATGAWLLAGELFARDRVLQLAAATVTGLVPMVTFVSASVNPDSLLFAFWSLALWLGVRILRRGLTLRSGAAFFGLIALAFVTKATTLALLPGAFLVLAIGVRRLRGGEGSRRPALLAGASVLVLVAVVGGYVAISRALGRPALFEVGEGIEVDSPVRLLASYLWQFYLPRLPFQQEFRGFADLPVYDYWVKGFWGAFGSLEVRLPEPVYLLLATLTVAVLAASLVALVRARREGRADVAVVAFFAVVVLSLVGALHYTEYRVVLSTGGTFNQGRYLLPLAPLAGVAAAAALTLFPRTRRGLVLALGAGALLGLQVLSLAVVAGRFYA